MIEILHISSSHMHEKMHAFSYHFKEVCKELGITINSISPWVGGTITNKIDYRFGKESFNDYYMGKKEFPLSRLLYDYPNCDLIFIENPKFPFDNDVDIPVFYYHRDMKSKLYVRNPTHLGVRFWSMEKTADGRPKGGQPELLECYHPEVWYNNDIKKIWLTHAISEAEFKDLRNPFDIKNFKRKKGFAYYGSYKSVDEMMPHNNIHFQIYEHHKRIIDFVEKHGLASEFRRINKSLGEYRKHLHLYDATLIIPAWDSWETRRLYEASYCKCVPILYIQNENARKVFAAQGYIHTKTCLTFDHEEDIFTLTNNMAKNFDLSKIQNNGFKLVSEKHSYKARIIELMKKLKSEQSSYKRQIGNVLKSEDIFSQLKRLKELIEEMENRTLFGN